MTFIEKAYAKINLFLDVIGRRKDGFHDIKSVMQSVSLCDTLTVSAEKVDRVEIILTSNINSLPTNNTNLVYRSALAYMSKFSILAKVDIYLEKNIPIGAGLGGGSSDAAATLRAINKIFGLASEAELIELAAEIGSDVPFCLIGGSAICTGRGEMIEKLKVGSLMHFVIAIGDDRISTPEAYGRLDKKYGAFADGKYKSREETINIIAARIENGGNVSDLLYNIFESVTELESIDKIKEIMAKNGAESCLMSGSGPAVFGIFKNSSDAKITQAMLTEAGFTAFVCHTV